MRGAAPVGCALPFVLPPPLLLLASVAREPLPASAQASGQRAAEAMAAAFQEHGPLEVNFATVVRVDSRGAYVMDE